MVNHNLVTSFVNNMPSRPLLVSSSSWSRAASRYSINIAEARERLAGRFHL